MTAPSDAPAQPICQWSASLSGSVVVDGANDDDESVNLENVRESNAYHHVRFQESFLFNGPNPVQTLDIFFSVFEPSSSHNTLSSSRVRSRVIVQRAHLFIFLKHISRLLFQREEVEVVV